jgi:hypothetical protein
VPTLKRRFRRGTAILVAVLTLTVMAETAALGFSVSKGGKAITAVKTVMSYDLITTTSTVPVAMPDMSATISVPASQRALLIITFSGEANCKPDGFDIGWCRLRVQVDDSYADPDVVAFDSTMDNFAQDAAGIRHSEDAWETNSMQFIAGPLSAGPHTVSVRWWIEDPGDADTTFRLGARTLTVLRSKV